LLPPFWDADKYFFVVPDRLDAECQLGGNGNAWDAVQVYRIAMKNLVACAFGLVLAACASYDGSSLRAGVSTEADARSAMGAPGAEYTAADGTRRLVYPHGPLGTQTYVVSVGRDGRVRDVRQALTDETFARIHPGLTEQEILEMIGPPGEKMTFARSDTHAWDYRYIDSWGYPSIFSVTFDAGGRVVSKISRRLEKEGRR
jgi:hypothetical protein